jgi:hypothetical protein
MHGGWTQKITLTGGFQAVQKPLQSPAADG